MTKEVQIDVLIKKDEIFNKKKKNKLYHNLKRNKVKTLVSNINKTRETIIYKRLSRRLTS